MYLHLQKLKGLVHPCTGGRSRASVCGQLGKATPATWVAKWQSQSSLHDINQSLLIMQFKVGLGMFYWGPAMQPQYSLFSRRQYHRLASYLLWRTGTHMPFRRPSPPCAPGICRRSPGQTSQHQWRSLNQQAFPLQHTFACSRPSLDGKQPQKQENQFEKGSDHCPYLGFCRSLLAKAVQPLWMISATRLGQQESSLSFIIRKRHRRHQFHKGRLGSMVTVNRDGP